MSSSLNPGKSSRQEVSSWSCPQCTFVNHICLPRCEACQYEFEARNGLNGLLHKIKCLHLLLIKILTCKTCPLSASLFHQWRPWEVGFHPWFGGQVTDSPEWTELLLLPAADPFKLRWWTTSKCNMDLSNMRTAEPVCSKTLCRLHLREWECHWFVGLYYALLCIQFPAPVRCDFLVLDMFKRAMWTQAAICSPKSSMPTVPDKIELAKDGVVKEHGENWDTIRSNTSI
jgi:hypothetical protein